MNKLSEFFKRCGLGEGGYTPGPARDSQALLKAALAKKHHVRYQASVKHPGYIEQVSRDGTVRVGHWINGRFVHKDVIPQ